MSVRGEKIKTLIILALLFSIHAVASISQFPCGLILNQVVSDENYFNPTPHKSIYYRYSKAKSGKQTLILLPGINRALPEEFSAIDKLESEGFGILVMATSVHWESLRDKSGNVQTPVTLKTLAKEAVQLVKHLEIKNPVAVSLSYSSAIAANMPYPTIQVAPMIKQSESLPNGPINTWQKYAAWSSEVTSILMKAPLAYGPNPNVPEIIRGYVLLAEATDKFDLSKHNFPEANTRRFILAESESAIRLKNQIKTFLKAMKAGPSQLIIVRSAEHDIPLSQPAAYVKSVKLMLKNSIDKSRVGIVFPKKETVWLNAKQVQYLFAFILSLPDTTEAVDLTRVFKEII